MTPIQFALEYAGDIPDENDKVEGTAAALPAAQFRWLPIRGTSKHSGTWCRPSVTNEGRELRKEKRCKVLEEVQKRRQGIYRRFKKRMQEVVLTT